MKIGVLKTTNCYIKSTALALMLGLGSCAQRPKVLTKDLVEFSCPTAAKLISNLEDGARHSVTVFVGDSIQPIIKNSDASKYMKVSRNLLKSLKKLPKNMEVYYQVYKGKADNLIQRKLNNKTNLLTVGHGNTGRGFITLSGGIKAYEGDYISQYLADSLCNKAILQKDSILKANISSYAYKNLKQNEKDAILSYLYNVNESLLIKKDSSRVIPESFFECISNGNKAKVQAKFNVLPSADGAKCGLAKRNLIQLLIYGDGEVYRDVNAQSNVHNMLDILNEKIDTKRHLKEVFKIVEDYGVDNVKLEKTKQEFFKYIDK